MVIKENFQSIICFSEQDKFMYVKMKVNFYSSILWSFNETKECREVILYFNHSEAIPYSKENMSSQIKFIPKDKGTNYILASVAS